MPKSKPYAFRFAIFLIATCAILTEADAQKVYKCGNVYSQIPCTDGVGLDAKDNRTSAQKAQADATTARTAAVASQMVGALQLAGLLVEEVWGDFEGAPYAGDSEHLVLIAVKPEA